MAASATFTGPGGADARTAIRMEVAALTQVTTGDLLHAGQIFRARIRERTFAGIDVNGAPFAPYSTKGPFYLSPAGNATKDRTARATASKNRYAKTGRIGVRTATGIKYASYAAAKSAHGAANVNLYGMEQHTHMLDTLLVIAGGSQLSESAGGLDFGGEFEAFEANQPCSSLTLGFYGPEAERAKGNNEGTRNSPKREFFALNAADLALGEKAIGERMVIRARGTR